MLTGWPICLLTLGGNNKTMVIIFTVFGKPQPKERARVTNRLNKKGKKITVTPNKTRWAEEDFRIQAARYQPDEPLSGPLNLKAKFFLSIPKKWSKNKRQLAINGEIWPTTTPDNDNLIKLVKDAMSNRFYYDDKQVVEEAVGKYYAEEPRIEIELGVIERNTPSLL